MNSIFYLNIASRGSPFVFKENANGHAFNRTFGL